MSIIDIGFKI